MAGELRISEYVPGTVIWTKRLCKCFLVGCMAAVVLLFGMELTAVNALRTRCIQVEEKGKRYESLVAEGDKSCGEGDMRLGEQYYLTALSINPVKPDPYLKLARIYRDYRYYDLALQLLQSYPGGNGQVSAMAEEIRGEIARLEVSVLQETEG